MAIVEVSIVPVGTGSTSVSRFVAGAVRVLQRETEVKYELTGMGTIIEGELEKSLAVVAKMHESAFQAGAMRVVTSIKIDDRRDKTSSIGGKVASVKEKLEN